MTFEAFFIRVMRKHDMTNRQQKVCMPPEEESFASKDCGIKNMIVCLFVCLDVQSNRKQIACAVSSVAIFSMDEA